MDGTQTMEDARKGAEFVRELVAARFPLGFAGWLRDTDDASEPFRLYIATPLWDVDGPVETVTLLDRFLAVRGADLGFDVLDVEIGPSTADSIEEFRERFHLDTAPFNDENWPASAETERDEALINNQRIYISKPVEGREAVKVARREFESHLAQMEAA